LKDFFVGGSNYIDDSVHILYNYIFNFFIQIHFNQVLNKYLCIKQEEEGWASDDSWIPSNTHLSGKEPGLGVVCILNKSKIFDY
jgi:hypothetical protein